MNKNALKLPKLGRTGIIVAIGLLGVLLIGVGPMLARSEGGDEAPPSTQSDAQAFAETLEARLTALLAKTSGVGKAEVMITLDGGYSYTYATAENINSDIQKNSTTDNETRTQERLETETSYIMVDDGDGKQPLVVRVADPKIRGVVIICEGGDDPVVAARVTETVRVALGVSAGRIAVMKLEEG